MRKILFSFLLGSLFLFGCGDEPLSKQVEVETVPEQVAINTTDAIIPFFYQYVGNMKNGSGENSVRVGKSADGIIVNSYGVDALDWKIGGDGNTETYGDPVFSYLSNGSWALTSESGRDDSRGVGYLLYSESSCPLVDDNEVIAIGPSSEKGCKDTRSITSGKTSQVFDVDGSNYVFHMIGGETYLAKMSDAENSAKDLKSICVLETPVETIADLDYGDTTKVIHSDDILLSDTAIGHRADGTWVLFIKGIPSDTAKSCKMGSSCELCARGIYRTTSTDLINWTDLEKVVSQASVPEAVTMPDGTVRLYWQDFANTCSADDLKIAAIAPISTAYEMPGTFELSEPVQTSYPDEEFESNSKIHYATNGNPVNISGDAMSELEACMN